MSMNARQVSEASAIPVEIFYQIFENLPPASLTSTARANSSFNNLSEKFMYRRLELSSMVQTIQCCQTLIRRPTAARAVRELIVMIDMSCKSPPAFTSLLSAALKMMTQLRALHLAIEGPFVSVLDGCFFPHLSTFSSIVDLSPLWTPMADFLHRHRTITHICMGGETPGQNFSLPADALPTLHTFVGSRRLAALLVPQRPVSRVTLAWHAANIALEVDCVVPPLAQAATPVRHLAAATLGWSPVLIRTLAVHLPKLYTLCLHNISADYHNEAELCATLTDVLASFPELAQLEVPCRAGMRTILSPEIERAAVMRWRKLCPKLATVVFPSARVWQRRSSGAWAPVH